MTTNTFKILFITLLLAPVVGHASIKFNVINVKNSSHQGHIVKAPFIIDDLSNDENIVMYGFPANLAEGLASGSSKSYVWTSGYIFRRNISGMYAIATGCNLDRQSYSSPQSYPMMFIPDNSTVDIKINCTVVDGNALKTPETTITVSKTQK